MRHIFFAKISCLLITGALAAPSVPLAENSSNINLDKRNPQNVGVEVSATGLALKAVVSISVPKSNCESLNVSGSENAAAADATSYPLASALVATQKACKQMNSPVNGFPTTFSPANTDDFKIKQGPFMMAPLDPENSPDTFIIMTTKCELTALAVRKQAVPAQTGGKSPVGEEGSYQIMKSGQSTATEPAETIPSGSGDQQFMIKLATAAAKRNLIDSADKSSMKAGDNQQERNEQATSVRTRQPAAAVAKRGIISPPPKFPLIKGNSQVAKSKLPSNSVRVGSASTAAKKFPVLRGGPGVNTNPVPASVKTRQPATTIAKRGIIGPLGKFPVAKGKTQPVRGTVPAKSVRTRVTAGAAGKFPVQRGNQVAKVNNAATSVRTRRPVAVAAK